MIGLALCIWAFHLDTAVAQSASTSPVSWDYAPYRIGLTLTSSDGSLNEERLSTLKDDLSRSLEKNWGGAWRCEWSAGGAPKPAAADEATAEDQPSTTPLDQRFELDVSVSGELLRLRLIAYDEATRMSAAPSVATFAAKAGLAKEIDAQLSKAFRPLLRATKWERDRALMRIRGGKLPGIAATLSVGTILAAYERPVVNGANPPSSATRRLNWTWLAVEQVEGSMAKVRVYSALPRSGDPGENEPIELLATKADWAPQETTLEIKSSMKGQAPLIGARVVRAILSIANASSGRA
ncbi:MAG: hypothetical protein QM811_15160 [Pirellulales bacterium]